MTFLPHLAAERLVEVRSEIDRASKDCGRLSGSVTLIAVSKTFDAPAIRPVLGAGHRIFGENRVQEAMGKWPVLRSEFDGVELHLIGPLQSNKARDAVMTFDVIETIDRPKIAAAIAEAMRETGARPKLYVQVNTGAEPQKAGILPQDADAFIADCRNLHGLPIEGLMCIPPADEPPSPHFALLAKIAARNGITTLSMGMSADFAEAIQCGATHVRIGSAIFGHR